MKEHTIIYQTRLHWLIFLWPLVFLFFSLCLQILLKKNWVFPLIFQTYSMLWLTRRIFIFYYFRLLVTNSHLIVKSGPRKLMRYSYQQVASIDMQQTIMGCILRYGALKINTTDGNKHVFHFVKELLSCRRHIEQLL